jgi:hypothetical protein
VQRHRTAVLAVLMGLVLLASVGVASWLVSRRAGAVQDAVEVLQHIRQRRLKAFWGAETEELWYIHRNRAGQAVGWSRTRREATATGYEGTELRRLGAYFDREDWALDVGARRSGYRARKWEVALLGGGRIAFHMVSSIRISYRDGRVEVERPPGSGQKLAAAAPDNYIPKGLPMLVYYLAAIGQRGAAFRMIFNERAIVGREVHFARAQTAPAGPQRVRARFGSHEEILQFDRNGQLVGREVPKTGETVELSSRETVDKLFRNVDRYIGWNGRE